MPPRWGMVIDLDDCLGCQACAVACKAEYALSPETMDDSEKPTPLWSKVYTIGPTGDFPDLRMHYLPVLCNHCKKPRCLESCPTGAIEKRADGIVTINQEQCTGCRQCFWACPYGAIFCPTRKHKASKCEFCFTRIEKGREPLCVSVCLGKCRVFGDLNEPSGEVNRILEENQNRLYEVPVPPHIDIGPSVYYLLR
jgi:tetrathionate reductase subunit B